MDTFRVWAPDANSVELLLEDDKIPLTLAAGGWWTAPDVPPRHGDRYGFVVDGRGPFPDPRTYRQPDGVQALSQVYLQDEFVWTDADWRGRALPGSVVYELHVGTFSPEGTFDAGVRRLDHLVDLGVDFVEVMPVAPFPGVHGWGYDGVAPFAVHEPYGGPDAFKRFVDTCHARGLGVVLDVVYNHLGPSGNYLGCYGPYFTDRHHTPWGSAVNLDDRGSDEVRRYVLDNALGWLRDYHVDGLRLDAVQTLYDDRAMHLLAELSAEVDSLAAATGRPLFAIAETDRNDPGDVTAREAGGKGMHAIWDDDVHHALHALLTGERQGYYDDFGSYECLASALTRAFWHDGRYSTFRGRRHGAPVDPARTPGHRFVVSLQTHDQVGNRARGERIAALTSPGRARIGAALLLCSPFTPMLFMGEEWAASSPWQYFTDHPEPDLARAVSGGRLREFAEHGWGPEDVPDPQDPATVGRSRLEWSELAEAPHAEMLAWYRALLALRLAHPDLTDPRLDRTSARYDEAAQWFVLTRGTVRVAVNLAGVAQSVPLDAALSTVLLATPDLPSDPFGATALRLGPESVAVVEVADA
ncbi:MAG: malto-oligosyltrehalose trehalohydrolase [Sporichthyaceae bacterium]